MQEGGRAMSDYESMQPEAPEWAIDEIHKLKELLSECAYSKHTQEAMDQELFDRIQKALKDDLEND